MPTYQLEPTHLQCAAGDSLDDFDNLLVAQHVPNAITADHEELVLVPVPELNI